MTLEYAWRGLVGVLVPQANTTAEPELAVLLPPGVVAVTGRMVSTAAGVNDRLRDYFAELGRSCGQFGNAPLDAIAVACTGASYLVGHAQEGSVLEALAAARGVPIITSGRAVLDALHALSARRVALVSPYDASLTEASVRYWRDGGVEVARVVTVTPEPGGFHPIYTLAHDATRAALDSLDGETGLDAVVMLGTGMPTLRHILDRPRIGGAPVLSCMLATAWRSVLAIERRAPSRAELLAWIDQPAWAVRLGPAREGVTA